jgi:hypothetical protein
LLGTGAVLLRDYIFHIWLVGHVLPAMEFVAVNGEARAREIANQRLGTSPNILAVEVLEAGEVLFRIERSSGE